MEKKGRTGPPTLDQTGPMEAVVRVGPLMGVAPVLRELGRAPELIFGSAGIGLNQFEDPDTEIPYLAASRLLARCAASTGCRHFGLLVGTRAGPSSLGIAGFMLRSAPDVGTALRGLVQHLDLHDQGGIPTLLIQGVTALLGYAIIQPEAEGTDQIYDLAIAVACNIMRSLCGESWNPTEVLLSRRPPLELPPYRRFFRAPLRFNAEQSALAFPSRWLDHQIASADPLLHQHLSKEAADLHLQHNADTLGNLHRLLRRSLMEQKCSIGDVARQLCIHERTLHRRLSEKGTSFSRELDKVRCATARQLLVESAMPINRIATTLQYADVSAFSRAFKRWTGSTPAQWRARNTPSG